MTTPHGTPLPRTALIVGAVIAVAYGVLIRIVVDRKLFADVLAVMSVAFISVVPLVVGFLAVRPTALIALLTGIIGYEGAICIFMAMPILLINAGNELEKQLPNP